FDQGIGDVFVIRVAGNVADTDEIGTIEYGVGHLKTPLLIVLGHSKCGAVTAVATGAEVHGSIPKLVDNIIPAVKKAKEKAPDAKGDMLVKEAITMNVWQAIEDTFKGSEEVRHLVNSGNLKVVGALYDIETGKVTWMGSHPRQVDLVGGH
ncbi:MAG: carbonic anhydrase, partial [Pseudomonadota bacterium]